MIENNQHNYRRNIFSAAQAIGFFAFLIVIRNYDSLLEAKKFSLGYSDLFICVGQAFLYFLFIKYIAYRFIRKN